MSGKSTSTQKTTYPEWANQAGQLLVTKGTEMVNKPFENYSGERVADLTGDQNDAFAQLRTLISNAPNLGPTVQANMGAYANAPAQQISTERVVDQGGQLGAIADYTNPAMTAADGPAQAAIRRIMEAADTSRKRIGAGATSAGAFGDARHGIQEASLDRDTSLAVGETAGKMYQDAYNSGMALRTGDLNRFLQTDSSNAALEEQALQRLLTGTKEMVGTTQADQSRMLQQIQALLGTGAVQQANGQAGLDALYQEFIREYGHDFSVLSALGGAVGAAPKETTTTTTQPNNGLWGILGSAIGSATQFI